MRTRNWPTARERAAAPFERPRYRGPRLHPNHRRVSDRDARCRTCGGHASPNRHGQSGQQQEPDHPAAAGESGDGRRRGGNHRHRRRRQVAERRRNAFNPGARLPDLHRSRAGIRYCRSAGFAGRWCREVATDGGVGAAARRYESFGESHRTPDQPVDYHPRHRRRVVPRPSGERRLRAGDGRNSSRQLRDGLSIGRPRVFRFGIPGLSGDVGATVRALKVRAYAGPLELSALPPGLASEGTVERFPCSCAWIWQRFI